MSTKSKETVLDQNILIKTVDFAYDKAVNGIPGFETAEEMGTKYLEQQNGDVNKACKSLVSWQTSKAATSGFLTGLGGIIIMPVTIPANIASVLYVQVRMIAAIAHIGGYDLKDDKIQTLVYMCLAGNGAKDIIKDVGIVIGTKMTTAMIAKISGTTLTKINQKVGFRLLTKFGEKGAINLGKTVPVVGGVIGGAFDLASTQIIGRVAKSIFIEE